jgi:hypothetical protein
LALRVPLVKTDGPVSLALLALLAKLALPAQLDLLENLEQMASAEVLALRVKLEITVSMECPARMDSTAHQALSPAQWDKWDLLAQLVSTALQEKTVSPVKQVRFSQLMLI